MTKSERLQIEANARTAINSLYKCNAVNSTQPISYNAPAHEFDIFEQGIIIGGVSTSTLVTTKGNPNTSSRDRAAAELLWLSLWQGNETRVHVLTCLDLANWLFSRFNGAQFPFEITIYHYSISSNLLTSVGTLGT